MSADEGDQLLRKDREKGLSFQPTTLASGRDQRQDRQVNLFPHHLSCWPLGLNGTKGATFPHSCRNENAAGESHGAVDIKALSGKGGHVTLLILTPLITPD